MSYTITKLHRYSISGDLLNSSLSFTNELQDAKLSRDGSKLFSLNFITEGADSIYPVVWDVSSLTVVTTGDAVSCTITGSPSRPLVSLIVNDSATLLMAVPDSYMEEGCKTHVAMWNQSGVLIRSWHVGSSGDTNVTWVDAAISPCGDLVVVYIDNSAWPGTSGESCITTYDASGIMQTSSAVPTLSPYNHRMIVNSSSHIATGYYQTIDPASGQGVAVSYDASISKRFDVVTSGVLSGMTRLNWGEVSQSTCSNHVIVAAEYWGSP